MCSRVLWTPACVKKHVVLCGTSDEAVSITCKLSLHSICRNVSDASLTCIAYNSLFGRTYMYIQAQRKPQLSDKPAQDTIAGMTTPNNAMQPPSMLHSSRGNGQLGLDPASCNAVGMKGSCVYAHCRKRQERRCENSSVHRMQGRGVLRADCQRSH